MGYMGHLTHIYSVWPLVSECAELQGHRFSDEGRVFKDEASITEVISTEEAGPRERPAQPLHVPASHLWMDK